jgi:hypothetical protein
LLPKNLKIRTYENIILPVALCGCETWSLTLRKEHRLRVFENRVLRRIFGPKEELHNLYSSPNIIRVMKSRRMRWAGHVARMRTKLNACRILMGRPEVKRPLGRPRRRWVGNNKMDLRGIVLGGMNLIDLLEDRDQWKALVNTVMNFRVP